MSRLWFPIRPDDFAEDDEVRIPFGVVLPEAVHRDDILDLELLPRNDRTLEMQGADG